MSSSDDIPLIGEVLAGKYRVEKILGQGGMGVVLAARHLTLDQFVAIKLLLPKAAKLPDATSRFLREAKIAAAIRSPHVARVLDAGTLENGTPYIAMEHLGGVDLARHLKTKGALPIQQAVDFMVQAGEAVAEAHSVGIIHRDLKPGNLFLTRRPDGSPLVKVLDFGLSKSMLGDDADGSLTQTGAVLGSPYYMSPEQLRSLKLVEKCSDVWAMGVILYELLTAQRPFEGHSMTAICAAVIADTPVPPRSLQPEIPEKLDEIILRCLEKSREKRMATVVELMQAIAPFGTARTAEQVGRISKMFTASGARREDSAVTNVLALSPMSSPPRDADASGPSSVPSGPPSGQSSSPVAAESAGFGNSGTVRIASPRAASDEGDGEGHVTGVVVWGQQTQRATRHRGARMAVTSAAAALILLAVGAIWIGMFNTPEAPAAPDGELAASEPSAAPEPAAPTLLETPASAAATEAPPAATEAPPAASSSPPAPAATEEPSPPASTAPAKPPAPVASAPPAKTAAKATTSAPTKTTSAPSKTTKTTSSPTKTTPRPGGTKKRNPLDRSD
jgi:serine/threonine protein kinase